MAGTSGCVPEFEVNVFGQLCKPARRLSSVASPKDQEADANVDDAKSQANGAPVTSTCSTDHAPKPDPISELFQKNQILIQSLSRDNVETYIATVKNEFKEVRQSRGDVRADHMKGQGMAVARQACLGMEYSPAEIQEAELLLRREELAHFAAACRCVGRERDQERYLLRRRYPSPRDSSTHHFTIKNYEQDKDEDTLSCREQQKREENRICSHVIM